VDFNWTPLYIRIELTTRSVCSIPTCAHHRHLQCPTNTALTTCSARQIQHLPPTMPDKYTTYHIQCPTNTALTTYTAQQIQHLPTMPDKYSTYHLQYSTHHLHCPTNTALTTYTAQQTHHLPPTLPNKHITYHPQ
jgi:hypothetical protein